MSKKDRLARYKLEMACIDAITINLIFRNNFEVN